MVFYPYLVSYIYTPILYSYEKKYFRWELNPGPHNNLCLHQ